MSDDRPPLLLEPGRLIEDRERRRNLHPACAGLQCEPEPALPVRLYGVHVVVLEPGRAIDLLEQSSVAIDDQHAAETGGERKRTIGQDGAAVQPFVDAPIVERRREPLERPAPLHEKLRRSQADEQTVAVAVRIGQENLDLLLGEPLPVRNRTERAAGRHLHEAHTLPLDVEPAIDDENPGVRRCGLLARHRPARPATQLGLRLEVHEPVRRADGRERLVEAAIVPRIGRQERRELQLSDGVRREVAEVATRADVDPSTAGRIARQSAHVETGGQLDESPTAAVELEDAGIVGEIDNPSRILRDVPLLDAAAEIAAAVVLNQRPPDFVQHGGRPGQGAAASEHEDQADPGKARPKSPAGLEALPD